MTDLLISFDQVQYFMLMFVRVMSMMMLMPVFGATYVPAQVKVALSLLLTSALFSVQRVSGLSSIDISEFSIGLFFLLVFKEAIVGFIIGFASTFLFTAVNFAGRMVDTMMGFGFVELTDPLSQESVTVLGQLKLILFTILFLLFNGHYFLLITVQKSFELVPMFEAVFPADPMLAHFTYLVANIFILGFKLAAPVFVVLFLTMVALGIVARTVPQMNIFFVGLPLKIALGLATTVVVLPMLTALFRRMAEGLIQDIWKLLYMLA
ncbi:MAG: flagellar biosynthetic protein FliR [Chitinispirillales bacterium]|jgi:flagellar biosynthetic protein FliR|nr:flagellar biosynthetic protein FliR [Chitinispirillales bacterium]